METMRMPLLRQLRAPPPPPPTPHACPRPSSQHVLIVRWRLQLHADVSRGAEGAVNKEDEVERIMREATEHGVDESRRQLAELSPLRPSEDSDVDGAADASDADADVAAGVAAGSVGGVAAATLAAAAALSCGDLLNVYVSTRVVWAGAIISLDSDAHTVHARMDWFDGTERSDVTLAGTKPLNSICCLLQHSLAAFNQLQYFRAAFK